MHHEEIFKIMKQRCQWVNGTFDEYIKYHDQEWGVPVHDDKVLFEFLTLEGAQAGLSWSTMGKKREGYREAFTNWEVQRIADYGEDMIQQLMLNPGIVRNQLKIRSTVTNAQYFIQLQDQFESFNNYLWSFVDGIPIVNQHKSLQDIPAKTELSDTISKDLKKRGFKFVGTTIIYAYMQAVGLVNDHATNCFRYQQV